MRLEYQPNNHLDLMETSKGTQRPPLSPISLLHCASKKFTMESPDVLLPASSLSQVRQPAWLIPTLQLLHGITAVTRWKSLSALTMGYALYSLVYYQIHRPTGHYLDVYIFGDTLITVVWTTCNDILFRNAEDFTRTKPDTADKKSDGNESSDKHRRSPWQQLLDALEIGFAACRGVGW